MCLCVNVATTLKLIKIKISLLAPIFVVAVCDKEKKKGGWQMRRFNFDKMEQNRDDIYD